MADQAFHRTLDFPLPCPAEIAYEHLSCPEFMANVRTAGGHKDVHSTRTETDRGVTLRLTFDAAPDLPAFARKLFSKLIAVVETVHWQVNQQGFESQYEVEVAGGTGRLLGSSQILPTEQGCTIREQFRAVVHFPLFRQRLEKLMIKETEAAMQTDFAFVAEQLSGHESTADSLPPGRRGQVSAFR